VPDLTLRDSLDDSQAVRTFRQFLRSFGLIERIMQLYFGGFGISGSQWGVLRNLHRARRDGCSTLRIGELSERMLIRPPSVTGVVDRLERLRLVTRRSDPTDLRARRVGLTAAGRKLVERILIGHERQIRQLLAGLDPKEQIELHRLLARLGGHLNGLLRHQMKSIGTSSEQIQANRLIKPVKC
jgi:MarR family transcriptional regulator, 2-MHQ and catechol-resistance regulon repressor